MNDTTTSPPAASATGSQAAATQGKAEPGKSENPNQHKPESGTSSDLQQLRNDIDEVKRSLSQIVDKFSDGGEKRDALRDGVTALESASQSAVATLSSREWVDTGTKWVRDMPLISVVASLFVGWTLASTLRR